MMAWVARRVDLINSINNNNTSSINSNNNTSSINNTSSTSSSSTNSSSINSIISITKFKGLWYREHSNNSRRSSRRAVMAAWRSSTFSPPRRSA